MDPKDIIKGAKNPDNIPGIYNYCDRWCERCAFTSRCLNREVSSEHEKDIGKADSRNSKFWDEMNNIFSVTMEMINHFAEKEGIDINSFDKDQMEAQNRKRADEKDRAMNHPITQRAKAYTLMVESFFKNEKEIFEKKEKEMNEQLRLGINEKNIKAEVGEIQDAFEVINWYNNQVWVKMVRALTSRADGEEWEDENGFQRDSDGSAKVALVGIDRSILAWGKLQQLFPEETDNLISFLLFLDKLRKQIETEFPGARGFKRPGFDD